MSRLLVLANLELAFDVPEDVDVEAFARLKERHLLRALRALCREEADAEGTLRRLEYEGFSYDSAIEAEPRGYYYNKHEHTAGTA
ncbi:MAG: hypothetical protein D6731_21490 [Planctomycetota bacterium]|nr:MAG: hypothetical protein D6731_21490 [Planctomycetota bacterium]